MHLIIETVQRCSNLSNLVSVGRSGKSGQVAGADYKNSALAIVNPGADLLSRMTLPKKVAQMPCIWGQRRTMIFGENGNISFENMKSHLKQGVGQIASLSDSNGGLSPRDMAVLANVLQKYFLEQARRGIPMVFHQECLRGLAAKDGTSCGKTVIALTAGHEVGPHAASQYCRDSNIPIARRGSQPWKRRDCFSH